MKVFVPDCASGQLDVIFVIDASGSIGPGNFTKVLAFVENVVNDMDIGLNAIRVGALTFADGATDVFDLKNSTNNNDVITRIRGIGYQAGSTDTKAGINLMRAMFSSPSRGNRNGVQDVGIILTDGAAKTGDPVPDAAAAKADGIILYCLGIRTDELDVGQVQGIASNPDSKYALIVDSFDALSSISDDLSRGTCSEPSKS